MRKAIAALISALLLGAAPASAQSAGQWSYAYTNGEAVATERNSSGEVVSRISCRPPTGELVIASYPLSRAGGGDKRVNIQIGSFQMEARGRVDRVDGERALVVRLAQSPPVIAGARDRNAPVTLSVGGRQHTFAPGGGQRMSDVAIACWSAA